MQAFYHFYTITLICSYSLSYILDAQVLTNKIRMYNSNNNVLLKKHYFNEYRLQYNMQLQKDDAMG